MNPAFRLIVVVLLFLGLERYLSNRISLSARGCRFIRRFPLLHPNGISLIRMPMGVLSIILLYFDYWTLGILWFSIWMISDLTDGTIARNCDLETETGKWLDPLSDKCMYFPALLYLSLGHNVRYPLPLPEVCIFIAIDILGQASRLFSTKKAANSFGKGKTALVTILLSAVAISHIYPLPLLNSAIIEFMVLSCIILAFLSFYCKIIPDLWYANTFTLANFLCGIAALWLILAKENYILGFVLVFIGQFFDLFDGRLARKYGSTRWGAVFDDIADGTSFGLAVAAIIYRGLSREEQTVTPLLAWLLAFFYLACLLFRLYRFIRPKTKMPPGIFQGLPSPAGALLAGSAVLAGLKFDYPGSGLLSALIVVISGLMMISKVPYLHFGQRLWPNLPRMVKLLVLIILIVFVNVTLVQRAHWESAFVLFCVLLSLFYLFFAVANKKQLRLETAGGN